jgi:hypothetical protein
MGLRASWNAAHGRRSIRFTRRNANGFGRGSFEALNATTRGIVRRRLLGCSALLAAIVVPGPASATSVSAKPAGTFYQAIGVNVHAWYVNNAWSQRLTELGVANVRAKVGTSKDFIAKLGPFFTSGGKINTPIVQSTNGTLDKIGAAKSIAFLKSYVGLQHVSGIEGPNEFNNGEPTNWAATERDFVKWLHDTVRADASFRSVPLIAPSVWKRIQADYLALGNLSTWVDKGCIHYYSGNRRPTLTGGNTMQGALQQASILAPGKIQWMTETGWQAPSGADPISPRAQAKYVLRNYFDAFGYGVEKIFNYQVMDDQTNLFGLTDANGNPKPSFTALKNLVALVKDTGGGTGSLDYSLSGAPSGLKQMLLQKSDGSFLLVLWLDVDSYGRSGDIETVVPMTVKLARSASFEVYQPTFGSKAQQTGSGSAITVFAADQVTVVKIRST